MIQLIQRNFSFIIFLMVAVTMVRNGWAMDSHYIDLGELSVEEAWRRLPRENELTDSSSSSAFESDSGSDTDVTYDPSDDETEEKGSEYESNRFGMSPRSSTDSLVSLHSSLSPVSVRSRGGSERSEDRSPKNQESVQGQVQDQRQNQHQQQNQDQLLPLQHAARLSLCARLGQLFPRAFGAVGASVLVIIKGIGTVFLRNENAAADRLASVAGLIANSTGDSSPLSPQTLLEVKQFQRFGELIPERNFIIPYGSNLVTGVALVITSAVLVATIKQPDFRSSGGWYPRIPQLVVASAMATDWLAIGWSGLGVQYPIYLSRAGSLIPSIIQTTLSELKYSGYAVASLQFATVAADTLVFYFCFRGE